MYACICNQVTHHEIHGAARMGVCTLDGLANTLGVGTCCGQCREYAEAVLAEAVAGMAADQGLGCAGAHAIIRHHGAFAASDQAVMARAPAA